MIDLLRLYAQIALLRRGPQDVPASVLLLLITAAAYFLANVLMVLLLPAMTGPWLLGLLLDVAFTFAWYRLLLSGLRRPERFVQTTAAVFGYRTVMAPLSLSCEWLVRRFGQDDTWQLPCSVLYIVVLGWMVAANSQLLKAALEWPMPSCVALVILELLASWLLVYTLLPGLR